MQPGLLRTWLAFFLLGICALSATPARASFGDCNDPAYLGQFDARFAAEPDFLCVESARVPVSSDAGTTHIRIVQHLVSDWATRPGAMRAFKDGVDASARKMGALGGFRISDVTILLVDGYAPGARKENFGEIAAWTNVNPGDECRITVWLLGSGATARYGASVVAHELFHCVQRSSLTRAQLDSYPAIGTEGGGAWWTEGSADWFSTVAVSPPRYMADRVRSFDARSPRRALNRMSYDAYVFFAWLGGTSGSESVMPFLHAMAPSASESAQRAAMIRALDAPQWLRFAEDYLDQRIHDGQGASIASTPQTSETLKWEGTRTQRIELLPFVIKRANISFRCGRWRVDPQPRKFHAVKPGGSETWTPFPGTIDATDGSPRQFRFAAMAPSSAAVALQLAGLLEAGCQECAGTREIDQCLVGTWQMTTAAAEQWMREHGGSNRLVGTSQTGNTMTLNADRTFSTGASQVRADVQGEGARGTGRINAQSSGRWSAAGGRFNVCPDASAMAGSVTTVVSGRRITIPMPAIAIPDSSSAYTCAGSSLRVTIPVGNTGPVTSVYNRISGPP
ncbi:MAG: hypothetical protein ABIN37_00455 [Burkholderiaceae bacterium]